MDRINNLQQESMLRVGTILRGIYRIDSYLSSGGFGNTYVATNIEFNERYAIKEFFMKGVTQRDGDSSTVSVSNSINQDSFLQQKEKFKKEARRLRQLNNPHIVKVHDLFEENGTAYYVMDFVDGENLAQRQKRTGKPMSEKKVREILPQILDALKSVHDAGIWHLDLKPANIMVDKTGQVKLIDFGASKQMNTQKGGATTSTAISYTNGFAPREQMEQNYDKFGPWTDLYALGATLYNLLTNKRPPLPTDIDDDMSDDKHLALPMPNVSDKMKQLILWLMKTNRMQRPQSIQNVKDLILEKNPKEAVAPNVITEHSQKVLETEETNIVGKGMDNVEQSKPQQKPETHPEPQAVYEEETIVIEEKRNSNHLAEYTKSQKQNDAINHLTHPFNKIAVSLIAIIIIFYDTIGLLGTDKFENQSDFVIWAGPASGLLSLAFFIILMIPFVIGVKKISTAIFNLMLISQILIIIIIICGFVLVDPIPSWIINYIYLILYGICGIIILMRFNGKLRIIGRVFLFYSIAIALLQTYCVAVLPNDDQWDLLGSIILMADIRNSQLTYILYYGINIIFVLYMWWILTRKPEST